MTAANDAEEPTYNLSQQQYILSSNNKDSALNVSVDFLDKDSFNGVLQNQIGFLKTCQPRLTDLQRVRMPTKLVPASQDSNEFSSVAQHYHQFL
jgi:hypothetical protein